MHTDEVNGMGSNNKMADFLELETSRSAERLSAANICRSRIRRLLDPDSFVELDALASGQALSFSASRKAVPGDGVVAGFGTIDGRRVFLAAQDPSVYGGSIGRMHAAKICRAVELAQEARVPYIGLYDTGGSRIEEGIFGLEGVGELIGSLDAASGDIPLIAAIYGPCAGGAAVAAAVSDFVLMSEDKSGLYMNGPMVVSAAENQSIEAKAIGGAAVHAAQTGLAALTAPDEDGLTDLVKTLLTYLPDCADGFLASLPVDDDPNRISPGLDDIAAKLDTGYDMRLVIQEITDADSFLETAAAYAPDLVTGLARMDGRTVGILANASARLDRAMADKAIRLAGVCDRLNLPLLTLVDTEGFAISLSEEKGGLVQAGANLIQTMLRLSVPRISVIIGKAIGTAYLALGSKSCGSDLVYAWPTAEIAVVNADTAAHIIYRKQIAAAENPAAARNDFVRRYTDEIASAGIAASQGHVDEVIRPSATRSRLISALDMLTSANV
jgi:methylmalonyl-CoA decarboxylase subunit alpha